MPSVTSVPFSTLIGQLPVHAHSISVEANDWNANFVEANLGDLWAAIFGGLPIIRISRGRLLTYQYATPEQKCAEILLWGYPNNPRGIVTHCLPHLAAIALCAASGNPWPAYFQNLHAAARINISTISKLAYFHCRTFNLQPALILDNRLMNASRRWTGVNWPGGLSYATGPQHYPAYLAAMHAAARTIRCSADQIEFFLFALGESF